MNALLSLLCEKTQENTNKRAGDSFNFRVYWMLPTSEVGGRVCEGMDRLLQAGLADLCLRKTSTANLVSCCVSIQLFPAPPTQSTIPADQNKHLAPVKGLMNE